MMRCRLSYTRYRAARSTTEVRVVTFWLQNPVVPSDVRKGNVQFLTAAFSHAIRTIYVALLA